MRSPTGAFFRTRGKALFRRWAATALRCLPALLLLPAAAQAHEFWMRPDRFQLDAGATARLSLRVGENFEGEAVGFAQPLIAGLRHYTAGGHHDLTAQVPATPQATLALQLQPAGSHLLAMDTHPSRNTLEAEKFNDYLREDGLWRVLHAREQAATTMAPGRERYRRNIKTLLQVGGRSDATFAQRTGQRLEIVPLADPYRLAAGQPLAFQVLFDGRPLPQALMKFWLATGEQRLVHQVYTDPEGTAAHALQPGIWMSSVVHMLAVTDDPELDWESWWGNLTFAVPAAPR